MHTGKSYIWKISLLVHPVQSVLVVLSCCPFLFIHQKRNSHIYNGYGFAYIVFVLVLSLFVLACRLLKCYARPNGAIIIMQKIRSIRRQIRSAIETTIYMITKECRCRAGHPHAFTVQQFSTLYKYTNKFQQYRTRITLNKNKGRTISLHIHFADILPKKKKKKTKEKNTQFVYTEQPLYTCVLKCKREKNESTQYRVFMYPVFMFICLTVDTRMTLTVVYEVGVFIQTYNSYCIHSGVLWTPFCSFKIRIVRNSSVFANGIMERDR